MRSIWRRVTVARSRLSWSNGGGSCCTRLVLPLSRRMRSFDYSSAATTAGARRSSGLPNGVTSRPRCDACSAMPDPDGHATCRCLNHLLIQAWTMTSLPAVPPARCRVDRRASSAERPPPTPPSDDLPGLTTFAAPRLAWRTSAYPVRFRWTSAERDRTRDRCSWLRHGRSCVKCNGAWTVAESDQNFVRANATAEERRDHDLARIRIIFGQDFLALPA